MRLALITLFLLAIFCSPIFSQTEPTKPHDSEWQLYSPGSFPQGWILPIERVVDSYGQVEYLYLVGDFTVTASGKSRSVLRSRDYPSFRFVVDYPNEMQPPKQNSILKRTPLQPLLVTDVKSQPNGDINVFLREIIK